MAAPQTSVTRDQTLMNVATLAVAATSTAGAAADRHLQQALAAAPMVRHHLLSTNQLLINPAMPAVAYLLVASAEAESHLKTAWALVHSQTATAAMPAQHLQHQEVTALQYILAAKQALASQTMPALVTAITDEAAADSCC
ncbi:hypothetical protein ABBQ38_011037 [Trebouxia sp. C0009 RCD-2024]